MTERSSMIFISKRLKQRHLWAGSFTTQVAVYFSFKRFSIYTLLNSSLPQNSPSF